jgi:hypothetical protein
VSLQGTVLDALSGAPLQGVSVVLCGENARRAVILDDSWSHCTRELTGTSTDEAGSFRLPWQAPDRIPAGVTLVLWSSGYLPRVLSPATLPSEGPSNGFVVKLRAAPTVDASVAGMDGKPIHNAGFGWFVEEAGTIRVRYRRCCSDEQGKISFVTEGVPEGEVTFFSTTGGPTPRFGTSAIATHAGTRYTVAVKVDQLLQEVHGQVVDAEGSPLAALVSVESSEPNALTTLDRLLLEVRGKDTDLEGNFEFRIASPARVVLRLSTWGGLDEAGPSHVWLAPLSAQVSTFGLDTQPVVLRAPAAKVVRCTMLGPANARLRLMELGIFFAPHRRSGHSGSCAWVGGRAIPEGDVVRATPQEVRFIWPIGSETLVVTAHSTSGAPSSGPSSESPSFARDAVLDRATDTCEILGM